MLEAEEDLLDAQNSLTETIVDYFNARLDLLLALEALRVDERGIWPELVKEAAEEEPIY